MRKEEIQIVKEILQDNFTIGDLKEEDLEELHRKLQQPESIYNLNLERRIEKLEDERKIEILKEVAYQSESIITTLTRRLAQVYVKLSQLSQNEPGLVDKYLAQYWKLKLLIYLLSWSP